MNKPQTIWITGASRGIGEALALAYAPRGVQLILSARSTEKLEAVAEQCRQKGAVECLVVPMDLSQAAEVQEQAAKVLSANSIDLLIQNAGISQRALAHETDLAVDRRIMEVDFFGVITLTKALLPHWREQRSGQIAVVSSLVGIISTPYRSAYAAAKHALHGFFEALRAEEHANGLRITMLCPGFIRTTVSEHALTGKGQALGKRDRAQARGMDPQRFAQKAIRAIDRQKAEIYIGKKEVWGVYLYRFLPGLFRKIIRRARVR